MKALPISVIILAHRNDSSLRKAVASVTFASEIIIIDNQSNVGWKEFPDVPLKIIVEKDPITNFSKVRNAALKEAANDWVFFVDSDEEVRQPVIPQLAAILASQTAKGAVIYRSDVFLGKKLEYGEAGHQQLLRIGKKDSMKFSGKVHEVAAVTGDLIYSKIQVLHHAHPSISEFIDDVSTYAQIIAPTKTTSFTLNLLEMIFYPPLKLFYGLVVQGGFLDGWRGLVYASCMSLHSLLVRIYRYELLSHSRKHS
jgi:glycosyltransferase involved in cell wall biosynthesis